MTAAGERERKFLALLDENRRILFKVANAYCRSAADRDDLIQEMTVALWKSFGRFDERYRFSTWAYRIALNVAISAYRTERRRLARRAPAAAAAEEPDERVERLGAYIAGLGDIDKALMLLYLDEHSYKTIAALTGLRETNVATKLSRLKARARAALTGDHDG